MLAERKHKIKWSPNPCGNLWTKDNNKFGQKILEKFGWSPGKGLGVKEQGIVAPVRLKCNSTQKGLGYEKGNKPEFFQHQEEFSSILSGLNSTNGNADYKDYKCISLEEKSKNCKTRVHYHKFTRGKDLSKYSEKDLSCILGIASALEHQNNSVEVKSEFGDADKRFKNAPFTDIDGQSIINDEQSPDQIDNVSEIKNKKSKNKKKRKRNFDETYIENENVSINCDNDPQEFQNSELRLKPDEVDVISDNLSIKKKRKNKHKADGNLNKEFEIVQVKPIDNYNSETLSSANISKKKKKKHKKNK